MSPLHVCLSVKHSYSTSSTEFGQQRTKSEKMEKMMMEKQKMEKMEMEIMKKDIQDQTSFHTILDRETVRRRNGFEYSDSTPLLSE